jgi:curved DNA-binding protein CbpA
MDYYKLLGVSPDAEPEEIRRAYRKLSLQYHPDFNPGNQEAADRFRQITEAYETLSDPDKRRRYGQSAGVTLSSGASGAVKDFFDRVFAVERKGVKR